MKLKTLIGHLQAMEMTGHGDKEVFITKESDNINMDIDAIAIDTNADNTSNIVLIYEALPV